MIATSPILQPSRTRMMPSSMLAGLVLILLLAFGLRIGGLSSNVPAVLQDDHKDYHALAKNLIAGRGYYEVAGFAYARQPGWTYLLTGIYWIAGPDPRIGVWGLACMGMVTVALTWQVGRAIGGYVRRRPRAVAPLAGILAAGIVACDPFLIVQDQTLIVEGLYTLLLTALLWLALSKATRIRAVLSGLLIGVAALTRSNGITMILPLVLWLPRRWLALALGVVAAVLIPWSVRNYLTFGLFTPFAPQNGTVLLGAYNEFTRTRTEAAGMWLYPPELPIAQASRDLPYLEREREWQRLAFDFIREHPADIPRMMGLRVARWALLPQYIPRPQLALWLITLQPVYYYGLLLIGSLVSILSLAVFDRRWRLLRLLSLFVLPGVITAAVFFGEPRFRAPYHPLLAALAAVMIARMVVGRIRQSRSRVGQGERLTPQ